jgi:hypothetical protein
MLWPYFKAIEAEFGERLPDALLGKMPLRFDGCEWLMVDLFFPAC